MKMKLAWKGYDKVIQNSIIVFLITYSRGFYFKTSLNPSTYDRLRSKVDQEDDRHHKNEGCLKNV